MAGNDEERGVGQADKAVAAATDRSEAVSGPGIDAALMGQLARLLAESDLSELEIEKGDLRVRMVRTIAPPALPPAAAALPQPMAILATPVAAAVPAAVTAPAANDPDHPGTVKSPMVGTAYRRQNPESKPFVEIGSVVKAGERVLLVEAMKTFNEIVAPRAGTVVAIFIEDGQPVEYGEPLLVVA